MRLVWARVDRVHRISDDLEQLDIVVDGAQAQAVCYPLLTGSAVQGDDVLVNTTAVDLGLGTGGFHFVVARAPREGVDAVAMDRPSGGHIMKCRYTPLQCDARCVEEQGGRSHDVMAQAVELAGMPVACCGLHSQVPLVAAAIKERNPSLTVAYVMSDSAALPMALSSAIRESVSAGLIDATISCGQAFGGEFEAVNLYSGLLAAKHVVGADIAVVGIGPGVVGTATPFGHGGVAQGEAVNAALALRGRPVAVLRLSAVDARARHRGVSHHTLTALMQVALGPAAVAVPEPGHPGLDDALARVDAALDEAGVWRTHTRVNVGVTTPDLRGVTITTMGRRHDDDPLFFAAAYAAGVACVNLIEEDGR